MVTRYVYAGENAIEETTTLFMNSKNRRKEFPLITKTSVYSNQIDDILAVRISGANSHEEEHERRGEKRTQGTIYFLQKDHLSSITEITDKKGNLVEQYSYDAFGTPLVRQNISQSFRPFQISLIGNDRLFTWREYNTETNLYYYRARFYDPKIGRFLSRDPIGTADQINLYTYVGNNPAKFVDRMGREKKMIVGTLRIYSWYDDPNTPQDGHAWIELTRWSERMSFGIWSDWGSNDLYMNYQFGHNSDILLNYERDKDYRSSKNTIFAEKWLTNAQMDTVVNYIIWQVFASREWHYNSPCSSFAADVWNTVADQRLSDQGNSMFINNNPDNLAKQIKDYNVNYPYSH